MRYESGSRVKALRVLIPAALTLAVCLVGQQTPGFETASVRAATPLTSSQRQQGLAGGIRVDAARVDISRLSLAELIWRAYEVKPFQVIGPEWLNELRFDVSAALPAGAGPEQIPTMLKALLAERFALKGHTGRKDFPVYAITQTGTGSKLQAVSPRASGPPVPKTSLNAQDVVHMEFPSITMPELAQVLSRFADRPVVDETSLDGRLRSVWISHNRDSGDAPAVFPKTAVRDRLTQPPIQAAMTCLRPFSGSG